MLRIGLVRLAVLAGLLGCAFVATPAQAQATRTWVSGVGDDVNPCSRTAPCKTFAGAIPKTAAGGEISVLDPGGFGTVTITKSISLVNDDSGEAGILAAGTNGVTVNAGATDVVILRGLVIDGGTATLPGTNGVRFVAGGSLHIEKTLIKNFTSAVSAGNGNGVLFAPSAGTSELYVSNSTFINNGNTGAAFGAGILIAPTGSGSAQASISHVEVQNNRVGIQGSTAGTTGTVIIGVRDTTASGNTNNGMSTVSAAAGGTNATLIATDSLVAGNGTGFVANGSGAIIRFGNSLVTGNGNAIATVSSGTVTSYKNNAIDGNANNNTPITGSSQN